MIRTVWRTLVVTCLLALHAGLAAADPDVGWWWNPNESGRGFFIESQGGIFYLAGYFYAADGRALWLVAGGPSGDSYHYQGRLLQYGGGQTLFGAYVPPAAPVDAGAISVDFSDDTHGTLTWPGGVVPLEREIFGTGPATYQPESGWWWNSAESGSGYSIEVQGNNLFFVGFMYDSAGNPVWYYSAGAMSTPTTYTGTLLQFANGQTLTGPYHPPGAPTTTGSLTLAFTAPDAATLTFSGAAASARTGQSRSIGIGREFTAVPHRYDLPLGYSGSFAQVLEIDVPRGLLTAKVIVRAIGSGMTWNPAGAVAQPPAGVTFTGQAYKFVPTGGNVAVAVTYDYQSAEGTCTGSAGASFPFVDFQSSLLITNLAEYVMQIGMQGPNLTVSVPVKCTVAGHAAPPETYVAGYDVKLISKRLFAQDLHLTGSLGPTAETAGLTRTGSWQLDELSNGY